VKLSIVVPTLDEAERLTATLASLAPLRTAGHEVIVVDGGSRDDTLSVAKPLADRVLAAPRGRAAQMNTGASVASGSVLLFLHADCVLPEHGAAAIEGAHRSGYRWGRFDVKLEGRSPWLPVVAVLMNLRSSLTGICTGDQGLFVERSTFAATGGYPPIPLMEDVALSKTLKATAGPPKRVHLRIVASGRRWDERGALATIATMWSLRFAWWRGANAYDLATRYSGSAPSPSATLKIFAKAPLPGLVKTRLAASIGADAAAAIYRDLVLRTLATAAAARRAGVVGDIELWVAPETEPGQLAGWAAQLEISLHRQLGADLGERMRHALRDSLAAGRCALLIGSDVPGFDVVYLAEAAAALQTHDAVVGPSEDGGYVLIGLARDVDAFADVAWSTPEVMAQTRTRLALAGATWKELPRLWDVDTAEDLARWRATAA
jgi:rSAM/selenodomain-associated transferase 2/rSAM/selenodomain-associated transferase 1